MSFREFFSKETGSEFVGLVALLVIAGSCFAFGWHLNALTCLPSSAALSDSENSVYSNTTHNNGAMK